MRSLDAPGDYDEQQKSPAQSLNRAWEFTLWTSQTRRSNLLAAE
jgi:hypothetical protein